MIGNIMKKYYLSLMILSIFYSCRVVPQAITSIDVDIIPIAKVDTAKYIALYPSGFHINQTFKLRNFKQDTLFLKLDYKSVFYSGLDMVLYYQGLKITDIDTKRNIDFEVYENGIKLPLSSKNANIKIEYFYQPDYMTGEEAEQQTAFMTRVMTDWQSWYFTIPDMKFEEIRFNVPPNKMFFVSKEIQEKKENTYYLNCKNIDSLGITFVVLEPQYYEKFKIDVVKDSYFYVYAFKGFNITNDSSSYASYYVPKDTVLGMDKYSNYLLAVSQIQDFFGKNISASIVDGNLKVSSAKFGMAFPTENNKNTFVLMDTAFWKSSDGLHEIIHLFNDIYPYYSKYNKGSSFFKESMTEFLAVYFYYKNTKKIDSVFNEKIKRYNEMFPVDKSIFTNYNSDDEVHYNINPDTKANDRNFGIDYGVIIQKTPYKIYSLGRSVGLEKFINILSRFYKEEVNKKTNYDFEIFRKFLLNNGVTTKQWNEFIQNL